MDENFFAGVKTEEHALSTGTRVSLPICYLDWTAIMAHFPVPAAKVRDLLPSKKLKPAQFVPGTAVVSMVAMEYRRIADMEPYNEFGILIPVLYKQTVNVPLLPLLFPNWFSRFGLYVHHLPVTTQEANIAGIEIWGYPKFIAEISFEDAGEIRRCQLRANGQDIVTLEVKKLATRTASMNFYSYTVKDSQLLRTLIQTRGEYGRARVSGGASFTLGTHPVAEELRSLDVRNSPVECIYATGIQSMLHPAEAKFEL